MPTDAARRPSLAPFSLLAALGLLSLLSLVPLSGPIVAQLRTVPALAPWPTLALLALTLLQPAILILAATALGTALAPRLGLRSLLAERARGERRPVPGWRAPLIAAVLLGPGIVAADAAFRLASPASFAGLASFADAGGLATRVMALLYGGVVEEFMLRYGLMTLLVWIGARLAPAAFVARPGRVVWPSIMLVALLFAAGHLPGLYAAVPVDGVLLARTLILNGAAGLVYGWLYWRRSLEHAMVAHAGTHLGFWTAGPIVARLLS